MDSNSEQNKKNGNKVQFVQNEKQQVRPSDDNSIPELQQKTYNLIATSKKIQCKFEQPQQNIEECKKKLNKLVNFINFHNIEPEEIWQQKRQLSANEFSNIMNDKYGYYLSNQELRLLKKVLNKKDKISRKDFACLALWQQDTQIINIEKCLSSSKLNYNNQLREKSKLNKSKNSLKTQNSSYYQFSTVIKDNKTKGVQKQNTKKTNTSSFLDIFQEAKKYSMAKQKKKVQQLKKDIKQSVLQNKWDFIVMAGQMNQWIQQLRKQNQKSQQKISLLPVCNFRFKVLNTQPVQIVQQHVMSYEQQQIPHIVFIKKYETLKKKIVKEQNHKNNLKGTVLMVLEDNQKFSKTSLINKINQRDQQLNFVLLQIMRMKSMFLNQNKILIDAGINS